MVTADENARQGVCLPGAIRQFQFPQCADFCLESSSRRNIPCVIDQSIQADAGGEDRYYEAPYPLHQFLESLTMPVWQASIASSLQDFRVT
jgi:hypothetical protein